MAKPKRSQKKKKSSKKITAQPTKKLSAKEKLFPFVAFAFGFLLYANTISHDFVLDDDIITRQNKFVAKGISGLGDIFSYGYLYGFNGTNDQSYRPFVLANLAIEKQFFGFNPHVHHFFNVFFYALAGMLLFLFLKKLFHKKSIWLPFIISLLFIAHPVHTEVVANIKSRDEILSFIFLLLSLTSLLSYARSKQNKSLIFSVLFFLFCVLSKDSGLAMIGLIPFTLYFFTNQTFAQIGKTFIPFVLGVLFYFLIRFTVMENITFEENMDLINNSLMSTESIVDRFATKLMIMGKYLVLLVFPYNLSFDYSFNQIPIVGFGNWKVLLSILVYVGAAIYAAMGLKSKNPISYAIIWFAIMIALVSNFLTIIGATMAERFLFVPSLGFCIIVGILLHKFLKLEDPNQFAKNKPIFMGIVGIVLVLFSVRTIIRNMDWKNPRTLYSAALKTTPNSARVHNHYGSFLRDDGEQEKDPAKRIEYFSQAVQSYQRSIDIYPKYIEAIYNKGVCEYNLGQNDKALQTYLSTLKINPNYPSALNNIGVIYFNRKNYDEALTHWNRLIQNNPNNAGALGNIGAVHHNKGDYPKAISFYEQSLNKNPNQPSILKNAVDLYNKAGNTQKAQFYQNKLQQLTR